MFQVVMLSRYSSFLNWVTFHLKAEYLMKGRPLRVWFGMVPFPSLLSTVLESRVLTVVVHAGQRCHLDRPAQPAVEEIVAFTVF